MLKEFKDFIAKGNVLDLAVGVIIGGAFGLIVKSFVEDMITPLIGIFGKADLSNMFVTLKDGPKAPGPYESLVAAKAAGADTLNYGLFITNIINFLIIAFVIFLVVKAANKMKKEEAAAPAAPSNEEVLLAEIRDAIKAKSA